MEDDHWWWYKKNVCEIFRVEKSIFSFTGWWKKPSRTECICFETGGLVVGMLYQAHFNVYVEIITPDISSHTSCIIKGRMKAMH